MKKEDIIKMSFIKYITEKLASSNYMKSPHGVPIWLQIFKNPTEAELERALVSDDEGADKIAGIRGLILKNGDIYIWNHNVFHEDVFKNGGFEYSDMAFRFDWEKGREWVSDINALDDRYAYSMMDKASQKNLINNLVNMFGNSARYVIFPDTMPGARVPDVEKIDLKSVKFN